MTRFTLVALLAACGAAPKQPDNLEDSIRAYNEGVRWGRYAVAAGKVLPGDRSQFIEDMDERSEDLRITDYEVVNVNARGSKEAKVRIKVSWYLDSRGTVHETHAEQVWEKKGKNWFMVQESRVRGDEMPGLAEPVNP